MTRQYPIRTIVKFYMNDQPRSDNRVLTNTFGKIGVIDRDWQGPVPQKAGFWIVDITAEIHSGHRVGCFILRPVMAVAVEDLHKLVPGMYQLEVSNNIVWVEPLLNPADYWIMPLLHKKELIDENYAVIVVLQPRQPVDGVKVP